MHLLRFSIDREGFVFALISKGKKKVKEDKKGEGKKGGYVENVGPNSGRVSTGQFPSSIDGPPSGNENFVYRVLANYSADRRVQTERGLLSRILHAEKRWPGREL